MMDVDLLVVGGGISGLTHAYKYLKKHPGAKLLLIEKARVLGGRCRQLKFGGMLVPGGAGVGRLPKDKNLYNLVKELTGEDPFSFKPVIDYHKVKPVDILDIIEELKKVRHGAKKEETFEQFFIRVKGKKSWEEFCAAAGYTDFAGLNVKDALYNYGFDDVVTSEKKFFVPWNKMVDLLESKIIEMGGKVEKGIKTESVIGFGKVELSNGVQVSYKDYILCVPPKVIRESNLMLMLNSDMRNYLWHIRANPFCYVYAIVDMEKSKEFVEKIKTYTVVPAPIQKIIPMSAERGIYMMCYADNKSATYLKNYIKTPADLEKLVQDMLDLEVKIKSIKMCYWDVGTHYRDEHIAYKNYKHLKGEAFALNQGWTNGGLS